MNPLQYSRQSYTIGSDNYMTRISEYKILIINYDGLCLEIIRNLTLLGFVNIDISLEIGNKIKKSSTIYCDVNDIANSMKEINSNSNIKFDDDPYTQMYDIVICSNASYFYNQYYDHYANSFIMALTTGLAGCVYNNFGNFVVEDTYGNTDNLLYIDHIVNDIITFKDDHTLFKSNDLIYGDETLSIKKIISKKSIQIDRNIKYSHKYMKIAKVKTELDHDRILHYDEAKDNKFVKMLKYEEIHGKRPNTGDVFSKTAKGKFSAMISIIGSIVCNEVIKHLTKKYMPINQWFFFDCFELYGNEDCDNIVKKMYNGHKLTFGKKLMNDIQNNVPFVVGTGAIGCELLKNLMMMGVKNVKTTDMDHIELSNLSRQFLFRNEHINKSKSIVAAEQIHKLNNDIHCEAYTEKICDESTIFNDSFFSNVDTILYALDNADTRIYMNNILKKYNIRAIDSGTNGFIGSVQNIIPGITPFYNNTSNNRTIPLCTLKQFPYKKEHTLHWAKEMFEDEFNMIPNIIKNKSWVNNEQDDKKIEKYKNFKLSKKSYMNVVIDTFQQYYVKNIEALKEQYGECDKIPKNVDMTQEFVELFFEMLNQVFGTNFLPDIQIKYYNVNNGNNLDNLQANPISFEKDCFELKHIDVITEMANLRNKQYDIELADYMETHKIIGKIIPAIITTTSLIAGLQIIEYVKSIKNITNNDFYVNMTNNNIIKTTTLNVKNIVNINKILINDWNNVITVCNKKNGEINEIKVKKNIDNMGLIKKIEETINMKIEFAVYGENNILYDGDNILYEQHVDTFNIIVGDDFVINILVKG